MFNVHFADKMSSSGDIPPLPGGQCHLRNSSRVREMTVTSILSELLVKHFPQVAQSECITLLRNTFQPTSDHCLIGNSVNAVLSCHISWTAYHCFWRKHFSFTNAKKIKIWRQLWLSDLISTGKINTEFPSLETVVSTTNFQKWNSQKYKWQIYMKFDRYIEDGCLYSLC